MNKTIIWVLVVVVLGAGIYWISTTQKAVAPVVVDSATEKITYSNSVYGISFTYPKGYVLTEGERGNAERAQYSIVLVAEADAMPPIDGEGPTAITVDIYQNNLDQLSLLDWLNGTAVSNFKLGDGTYSSTTVNGTEAVSYNWSGLYEGETTAFLHAGNIVVVSMTRLTPQDVIITDYRALLSSIELSE